MSIAKEFQDDEDIEYPCPYDKNRVPWMHAMRLPPKSDNTCFVCRKKNTGVAVLRCGRDGCPTQFHLPCLTKYSAGDFNIFIVQHLAVSKQLVCPLHVCSLCFYQRYRCSAAIGKMVECDECYRAFHLECRPPGSAKKGQAVTCNLHVNPIREKYRMPFCCVCLKAKNLPEDELLGCTRCVRSYHNECHKMKNAVGAPEGAQSCTICISGVSYRIGDSVIAKFYGEYHAGYVRALEAYRGDPRDAQKEHGLVAIQWKQGGQYSLVKCNCIVPLFEGADKLFELKDDSRKRHWLKCQQEIIGKAHPNRPIFKLAEMENLRLIDTSIVSGSAKVLREEAEDDARCSCPTVPPGNTKCARVTCLNSPMSECPPSCASNGQICLNRMVANKTRCEDIIVFETVDRGRGIKATKSIAKGTFILEYAGEIISKDEEFFRRANDFWCFNIDRSPYFMSLDKDRVVDCRFMGNDARLFNHSCEPNCLVNVVDVCVSEDKGRLLYDKRVYISTAKNIAKDEELTIDYRMETETVTCLCNTPSCTKRLLCAPTKKDALRRKRALLDSTFTPNKGDNASKKVPRIKSESAKIVM